MGIVSRAHMSRRDHWWDTANTGSEARDRENLDGAILVQVKRIHRPQNRGHGKLDVVRLSHRSRKDHGWSRHEIGNIVVQRLNDDRMSDWQETATFVDSPL